MWGFLARTRKSDLVNIVRGGQVTGAELDNYVNELRKDLRDTMREGGDMVSLRSHPGFVVLEKSLHEKLLAIDAMPDSLMLSDPVRFIMARLFEKPILMAYLNEVHGRVKEYEESKALLDTIEKYVFEQANKKG